MKYLNCKQYLHHISKLANAFCVWIEKIGFYWVKGLSCDIYSNKKWIKDNFSKDKF